MRHFRILLLTAVLAAPSLAVAQSAGAKASGSSSNSDFEQVSELDRQWLKAAVTHHTDVMERIFADDFVEMHAGGEVVSKRGQIDQIKSPMNHFKDIYPEDLQMRYASPIVIIMTDTTTVKGANMGKDQTGKYRVLRVFVKQHGKWRAAGAALTLLPAQTGGEK
jgi:ketosteroid isomerase-like protein